MSNTATEREAGACQAPGTTASDWPGQPPLHGAFGFRLAGLGLGLALGAMAVAFALPAAAQVTNTSPPKRADFSDFRVVPDRNIFNQHRSKRSSNGGPSRPTRSTEAFTLVGTMSFEKGQFAFFEGSRSEYQKVLKPNEVIAGYTVTAIAPAYVKLASGTNDVQLRVGMQMRRSEDDLWEAAMADAPAPMPPLVSAARPTLRTNFVAGTSVVTTNFEPAIMVQDADEVATDSPSDSGSTNAVADAAASSEDPVLKRLMQRREQEISR